VTNIGTIADSVTNSGSMGRIAEKSGPDALKGRKRRIVQAAIYRILEISE
jgi:hypothetical protein